ncbi:hypothetical protein [Candidatus Hodgkinia cicadicola]
MKFLIEYNNMVITHVCVVEICMLLSAIHSLYSYRSRSASIKSIQGISCR